MGNFILVNKLIKVFGFVYSRGSFVFMKTKITKFLWQGTQNDVRCMRLLSGYSNLDA